MVATLGLGWTGETFDQASGIEVEGRCQGEQVEYSDIAFAAFGRAHVGAVQAARVRQLLLRQSSGEPCGPDAGAELDEQISIGGHAFTFV